MVGLRSRPLSLSSCGRLHARGARQAREATVVCARVEATTREPGSGDSTVVVAPTAHQIKNKGGRGADETQPHRFFVKNSNDTMAHPPIRNMILGAVHDGQRVDVGTLPQGVRWKHVSVADVIRIDDVYTMANADPRGSWTGQAPSGWTAPCTLT